MYKNNNGNPAKNRFYCIWVRTGSEEEYIKEIEKILCSENSPLNGKLYFFKKQMQLKTGKNYVEPLFAGYVFFETNGDENYFYLLRRGKGFISVLPKNDCIQMLGTSDFEIVKSILQYGCTIPIVHVDFDKDEKILLLDGPFKDMSGKVKDVNRRNRRVNIQVEFMNGIRMVGLTYEKVQKA